jgi:hypothetical protein
MEKPNLFNRVAQTLATGSREKAILLLEEDNHPSSTILSFSLKHSAVNVEDIRGAFDYASLEMEKRLTYGTRTLAWLTIWIPVFTAITYLIIPVRPSGNLLATLISAIIAEVLFWNVTLIYVKLKVRALIKHADIHFSFLSGMAVEEKPVEKGLQDHREIQDDIIDLSAEFDRISKRIKGK